MIPEHIILQSAGSLSVGILALIMLILQVAFFLRRPRCTWYAWGAATAFSALLYSIGIFIEYNTPAGSLNRFAGLLEFTAIICVIHCVYGFTFSYLGLPARRYHWMAGIGHGLILILLWFTPLVVAHRFVTRHFITSTSAFTEVALGPLGPFFVLYAAAAGLAATIIWIRSRKTDPKHRIAYLAGIGFWLLLGIHDGLVALGVSPFQYVMEYGFLGFAVAVLWVVFDSYLEIAAEEKYRTITEFANDCILVIQDGEVVFGNPACGGLMGRPIPDEDTTAFLDMIDPEDRQKAIDHQKTLMKGGAAFKPYSMRIQRANGEKRSTEIASSVIQYRNRPAVLAVVRDVTEREVAREALRKSEERLRMAGQVSYDLLYEWDVGSDAIEWFGDVDDLLGYPKGTISRDIAAWLEIIHPEDRDMLQDAVDLHRASTEPIYYEYRVKHQDGTYRHWKDYALPLTDAEKRPYRWVGVCTDITERRAAEAALRESEQRFRTVADFTYDWEYWVSPEGHFLYVSPSCERFTGYGPDAFRKDSGLLEKLTHPDDKPTISSHLEEEAQINELSPIDYRIITREGKTRWISHACQPVYGDDGTYLGRRASNRDITERKQAEEALLESDRKFRTLFDESPQAVAVTALETGTLVDVNLKFCELSGYDKDEMIGKTTTEMGFYSQADRGPFIQELRDKGFVNGMEIEFSLRDGAKAFSETYARIISISGKPHVLSMFVDITEQRRLESRFLHAQKMESVGRLAGGVAHDFNNMLGVILGRAEMALMGMKPEDPHYRYLKEIQKVTERSAELPRQLLAFARKQTIAPEVLYLNDTVEGMLKMLRRLIGEDIDFTWRPGANLWLVRIDPSQIDQILANLCVNARDAVSGAGKVTLETQNATLDETFCETHVAAAPGEYVLLAVSDNGCGMDKDLQDKAFEPFFTTKDVGKGTGLGLSTVYGIVKQNNGFVYIYSEPNEGTTVKIFFPRYRGTAEKDEQEKPPEIPLGFGETILLVEDNPDILASGKEMLEELGYRVMAADGPEDALKWTGKAKDAIHLLMTDVIMPGMNGRELAEQITAARPDTRVLFMSGYTADAIAQHGVLEKDVHFLQKPFTLVTLARKVRAVLAS